MKGATIHITVLTCLTLLSGLIMSLILAPSWSQTVYTMQSPLLYVAIVSTFGVFLLRSMSHPKKDEWNIWYINKQWNRITAYCFFGIAITPVTHELWWIETLHLIFTGAGIISGYIQMIGFQKSRVGMALAVIGTVVGSGGFLYGFLTPAYSISVAELIAAVPLSVWVLRTNKSV